MPGKRNFLLFLSVCFIVLFFCSCSDDAPFVPGYERTIYNLEMQDGVLVSDVPWVVNIEKQKDRDFVILNLTDIQLGTTAFFLDFKALSEKISAMVEECKPDMITFTGDMSYGCGTAIYGICSFLDSFGIPWAPVFGNHDHENSGMSPAVYANVLKNFSNCLFKDGPDNLTKCKGNYVVNLYEKGSGSSFSIVKSMIFMNSGTSGINEMQNLWYEDCLAGCGFSSSAVFMHIPIYGYRLAATAAFAKSYWLVGLEESYSGSSLVWKPGYENSFGVCHESIGPSRNDGLFDLILQNNSTDLVVCGHNHNNCACICYKGVKLVYGLKTGPGCYYEEGMDGGTVITVSHNGLVEVEHCFADSLLTT